MFIREKSKVIPKGHLLSIWILRSRKPGWPATPAKKRKKDECWSKTFMEHLQKQLWRAWQGFGCFEVKRIEIPVSNAPVKTAGRQQDWEAERVLCHFLHSSEECWDVIYCFRQQYTRHLLIGGYLATMVRSAVMRPLRWL